MSLEHEQFGSEKASLLMTEGELDDKYSDYDVEKSSPAVVISNPSRHSAAVCSAQHRSQVRRRRLRLCLVLIPLLLLTFKAWDTYRPSKWCILIDPDHVQKAEVYEPPSPPSGKKECTRPRRSYEQHETFRSITGRFDLYDDLSLSTATGAINVIVYLQAGCGPQTLRVNAQTGSIRVNMIIEDDASVEVVNRPTLGSQNSHQNDKNDDEKAGKRPINTFISTKTGSVYAELIHGNGGTAKLATFTGSMNADVILVGVGPHDPVTHLSTSTSTGSQHIRVAPATSSETKPVVQLSALHESSTGWMNLEYPHAWMGKVWARATGTGSVSVEGDNLRFVKGTETEVLAYRGNTTYQQEVVATSYGTGSIQFHC